MRPVVRFLKYFSYNTYYVEGGGAGRTLAIGNRVGLANTLFNLSSGSIRIEDQCVFGYNVMLLTGQHRFANGERAGLTENSWGGGDAEVPSSGFDICIGRGTWIASGVIVVGGVTIGRNVVVAGGAIVTHDLPDYSLAAGIPARVIGDTRTWSPRTSTGVSTDD